MKEQAKDKKPLTNVSGFANTQPTIEASLQTIWDAVERAAANEGISATAIDAWLDRVAFVRATDGWVVEVNGTRK